MFSVTYQLVNEEYAQVRFGNIQVLTRLSDGYVNATKMVNEAKCIYKKWRDPNLFETWLKNETSKELIAFFSQKEGRPALEYVIGSDDIKGNYVCRKLAWIIASWLSKEFAYEAGCIIDEEFDNSLKEKRREFAAANRTMTARMNQVLKQLKELGKMQTSHMILATIKNDRKKITSRRARTHRQLYYSVTPFSFV